MKMNPADRLWTSNSPSAIHHNIEVKIRCSDLANARRLAKKLGARSIEIVQQTDTYFCTQQGRLKLRETKGGSRDGCSTLISYSRPNRASARDSQYRVVPIADGPA